MKKVQKWLAVVLAVCFCLSAAAATVSAEDAKPASQIPVGGTFYFGSFPQSRVKDSGLLSRLNAMGASDGKVVSLDGNTYQCVRVSNYAVPGGDQGKIYTEIYGYYPGMTYWFRVEPIAWKVLAADESEVLLMADRVLTTHAYNKDIKADNTWENSDLRSWLNGDFLSAAFTLKEQAQIWLSDTPNQDSFIPGSTGVGGNDTKDQIFLPSIEEITDKTLGFLNADYDCYDDWGNYVGYYAKEPLRQALSTDFARSKGVWVDTRGTGDGEVEAIDGDPGDIGDDLDNVDWEKYPHDPKKEFSKQARYWLRSPGSTGSHAAAVLENGRVTTGWPVNYTIVGIRPWMRVSPDAVFDGTFVPPQTGDFALNGIDSETIRYRQPNIKLTADAEGVTWTSSDPSVATVDADGNVTITGVGAVTFTATDADGNTVSKTVEVRYTVWQWIIRIFLFGWLWY